MKINMNALRVMTLARLTSLTAACLLASNLAAADSVVDSGLDQGWSASQKAYWYTMSQGSRLIPLKWLRALEQPNSTMPFLDRSYVESFRYLANPGDPGNPGNANGDLPLGFAIDIADATNAPNITRLKSADPNGKGEAWVGMNCSACHTAEIAYRGIRLRIDGGPTLADFQGFMGALRESMNQTRTDQAKWSRFASAVLAGNADPAQLENLKSDLSRLADWEARVARANATPLAYGFGRLDAFGNIFNKVVLSANASTQPPSPSDAPVSYPFLWNIHQHDKVQWNGIARNVPIGVFDVGALGRNVGEVIGVFADLTLVPPSFAAIAGYPSSVKLHNLIQAEGQIQQLRPPAWPQAFPAIKADLWDAGRKEFMSGSGQCSSCHQVLPRNDVRTRFQARMSPLKGADPIGTDIWMACNAYLTRANTGALEGTPPPFFVGTGPRMGKSAPVADLLNASVIGSIWNQAGRFNKPLELALRSNRVFSAKADLPIDGDIANASDVPAVMGDDRSKRQEKCLSADSKLLAYKGRPLMGIWATAPYLHNGSVSTLYELLLPPTQRRTSFSLGTREFDPVQVGFVADQSLPENSFVFRTIDPAGAPIPGNSNLGHDYGNATFSDAQRWALVEYMKAVGGRRIGNRVIP